MTILLEDRINKIFDELYEIRYSEVEADKYYIQIDVWDKKSQSVHSSLLTRQKENLYLSEVKAQVIIQACGFVIDKYERMKHEKQSSINAIKKALAKEEEKI